MVSAKTDFIVWIEKKQHLADDVSLQGFGRRLVKNYQKFLKNFV